MIRCSSFEEEHSREAVLLADYPHLGWLWDGWRCTQRSLNIASANPILWNTD